MHQFLPKEGKLYPAVARSDIGDIFPRIDSAKLQAEGESSH